MFYFGGMTLGYLEKPSAGGRRKDGERKARRPSVAETALAADAVPAKRDLLARANWFNLYW